MQRPTEANQEPIERASRRQSEQPAIGEPGDLALCPTPAAPRAQEEQGLPTERVEVPHLVWAWIGRQRKVPVELYRARKPEGGDEHAGRPEPDHNRPGG